MAELSSETLHATAVAIGGWAVVVEGPSGSGKSDLALRLIDRGATLIADDRTICTRRDGALYASCPPTIAGKLEVRGIGIIDLPRREEVPVALVASIGTPERMPDAGAERVVAGHRVAAMTVAALEPSAPIKVEQMLRLIAA